MAAPLVSVLMPCFNAAPFVGQAVESVLSQTYPHVELIVVDDGSTDDSAMVLKQYAGRVIIACQRNSGASAARNSAFERSCGDFVLFVDADDVIGPDHIERLVRATSDDPMTVGFGEWARFWGDPSEAKFSNPTHHHVRRGEDWLVERWTSGEFMTQPGMFLLPRAFIREKGSWDVKLSLNDDFEFYCRMLVGANMRFADGAKLFYRSGVSDSLSGARTRAAIESNLCAIKSGIRTLLATRDDESARRAAANALMFFVYETYPFHRSLCMEAQTAADDLGGGSLVPVGPPRFHLLRRYLGWKAARLVQIAARQGISVLLQSAWQRGK